MGSVVFAELRDSGVLVDEGGRFGFHRSSFRDFFAGHHIFRRLDVDQFAELHFARREWGSALVFAAGLRRANSRVLTRLALAVENALSSAVGGPSDDTMYSAFVLGRMLSNSESSDHADRVAALSAVLRSVVRAIPEFEKVIVGQYGQIGRLMALLGAEQSLFTTLGVPWLRQQLLSLIAEALTSEEERFLLASTYVHLGFDDSYKVLGRSLSASSSTRVFIAADILLKQLAPGRKVGKAEAAELHAVSRLIKKRLAVRVDEVRDILKLKSPVLEIERQRMRRILSRDGRER